MSDRFQRVYKMSVASVYPLYIEKAEKKGRTKEEVDEIFRWLTGHSQESLEKELADKTTFADFFNNTPAPQPCPRTHHRHRLRRPGGGNRGAADARNPLSRQAHRRAGEGEEDGEDFEGVREH